MAHKYKKLSPIDHVLLRPEMYVGSVESQSLPLFLYDEEHQRMEWTTANLNHGLLKIVDEIVLNAADNIQNSKRSSMMTFIKVSVDANTGKITVENDGAGIPIVKNKENKLLIPEMIFGHLLTSSNYDNDPDSMSAGRHGYGAKLTNIMSQEFVVHCQSGGKQVTIRWSDHMRTMDAYTVQPDPSSASLTRISFTPDFSIFGCENLSEDMYRILRKRIVDLAAAFPSVSVSFNGDALNFSSFSSYAKLFLPSATAEGVASKGENGSTEPTTTSANELFLFEGKHLRIAFIPQNQPSASKRSFSVVNGVITYSGGSHVQAAHQILTDAVDALVARKKREDGLLVNGGSFIRYFTTLVFLETPQPKFDSQSKVRLVSKVKFPRFPSRELEEHLAKMTFLADTSKGQLDTLNKELNSMIQTAKKRPMIASITKLVDAASAGGSSRDAIRTLIVTEGDSAKALALNSLSNDQRKHFGVFPLRGKLLNVRNNNLARLKKCKELCELFSAIGIEIGRQYTTTESLRYQRIMIMTDQDADGTHIRGLLISAFESLWPTLLHQNHGFLCVFSTPLIRATTRGGDVHSFYSVKEFHAWKEANQRLAPQCFIKYYKGLGTSTTTEGKEYFKQMEDHLMLISVTPADTLLMDRVFDADEVLWRKEWLTSNPVSEEMDLDRRQKTLTLPNFVDKELIHFATAGNLRALPCSVDGLKPSQRKILWSCFRRSGNESLKVSQLSGFISEVSAFHHGEMSLQQTIIKMAQDYIGSNNVNLLEPEGQFGSRQHLGSDHAAARYIFTKLSPFARMLFPKEDDELLVHVEDEGKMVEPRFYVPIIPMLLVNGSVGIGFGFASTVQQHHPLDVVMVVRRMMYKKCTAAEAIKDLRPWAVGFSGTVAQPVKHDDTQSTGHVAIGRFSTRKVKGFPVVRVEELPWDRPIEQFRGRIAKLAEDSVVLRIADYSGANHVDSDVVLAVDAVNDPVTLEKNFLLTSNMANNAAVYSPEMVLSPLGDNLEQIVTWHYEQRLALYTERRKRQLEYLNLHLRKLKSTLTFTEKVRGGDVDLRKMVDEHALVQLCASWKLHRENDSFDYLTRRPLTFFTNNNVDKLKRDIETCNKSIKDLQGKTEVHLWEEDLSAFESAFIAHEEALIARIEADRRPPFSAPEVEALSQEYNTSKWKFFRRRKGGSSRSPGASACGGTGGGDAMVVREWMPLPRIPPATSQTVTKFVGGVAAMIASNMQMRLIGRLVFV